VKPTIVGMHEAKTHLSKLVRQVEAGHEVVLESLDRPVAKIVPYAPPKATRTPGRLKGKIVSKPGFDEVPAGFEILYESCSFSSTPTPCSGGCEETERSPKPHATRSPTKRASCS
jgi:prevent-host-death family protein